MKLYLIYLLIINVITFSMYGIDKYRSKRKKWRIKEATLILFGFLGGFVGALSAMQIFRHKTKHFKFWLFNILALIIHISAAAILFDFIK